MDTERHERRELQLDEVSERDASPEVAEVYARIKDTLRVNVVNYVWRVFATKPAFLRAAWEQLEPAVDEGFMQAAEGIRAMAIERVRAVVQVTDHRPPVGGGLHQATQELRMFMDVNPRLLIMLCALHRSWMDGEVGGIRQPVRTERGLPPGLPEVEEGSPSGPAKKALDELVEVLDLPAPNTDYRVLAKWPDYFAEAWQGLRTFVGTASWTGICETAEWIGEQIAIALPASVRISPKEPAEIGLESQQDVDEVATWIDTFHGLLPGLIVNTSYLWIGLNGGSEREVPLPGAFEQSADER